MTCLIRADEIFLSHVVRGDLETVQEMLTVGKAQVNAKCQNLTSPLHWAASQELPDMCTLLLKHGAKVDALAIDGSTPLHFAARESCPRAVSILLGHGADACAKNNSGSRPIQLVYDEEDEDDKMIVDLLTAAGGGYLPGTSPAEEESAASAGRTHPSTDGAVPRNQVATAKDSGDMDDAVIGNGDGRVQRIVEATVVETRRPIGRGGAGFAPPFRIEPLREGMRCMAIGTDTDFPGDLDPIGEDEEPLSAVSITEISVVFAASSSIGTSTSDL